MKKILTSLGMIVFAAAIVVGGTGAFFSDTETSTGNVFTAGALDLTVDSEAHYNGMVCVEDTDPQTSVGTGTWQAGNGFPNGNGSVPADHYPQPGTPCVGTWAATDLGAQTFFNFTDVKPGDEGENTISLHINNNPAWACVDVTLTKNDDVSSTEPELDGTGDVVEDGADPMDGELAQNLKFAAWLDQGNVVGWQNSDEDEANDDEGEGDNIWQGEPAEPLLFSNDSGPASDVLGGKTYALADATTLGGPMAPNVTNYIGLAWCAGDQTIVGDTILCDGSNLGNIVQTDSMEASIAFRVEQHRNNEDFTCVPREPEPTATTLTLEKVIQQDGVDVVTEALWTLTATGPVVISGIETAPEVTAAPVPAGDYVLTESAVQGFTQTGIGCVGGTLVGNTVTVTQGANVVCTFTNSENT